MIKATELRLGNLIYYNGEAMTVYSIDRGGHTFYRINDIPINKSTGCTINGGEDVFSPTPLTEEWLRKFGFEESKNQGMVNWRLDVGNKHIAPHGDNRYEFVSSGIQGTENADYCSYTVNGYWGAKRCDYVHQLQNLHFALTGEELTTSASS